MDSTIISAVIGASALIIAAVIQAALSGRREKELPMARSHPDEHALRVNRAVELDEIVERLERYRQRATYGAVAGLLNRDPYTLFNGYPYTPRNSWVVRKSDGLPTGYHPQQLHPDLRKNSGIIQTTEELKKWLSLNS
jgi:hypothetical protein